MTTTSGLMLVLAALVSPAAACAQSIFGLTPPRPGDIPVAPRRDSGPEKRPSSRLYSSLERETLRGSAGPGKFLAESYRSYPISRTTFLYFSPLSITTPQPIVIMPRAGRNEDQAPNVERVPPPVRPEVEAPAVRDEIAPGAPASVFRPIKPEDRARAMAMPPDKAIIPYGPPEPENVPSPPREPPPLPGPPVVAVEPKTASGLLMDSGKSAFRAHQYSRAERLFRRATEAVPDDAQPYFLLAQARFALGKYAEAVAAIQAGMRLRPDWPNAPFRVRELYGADPNHFSDHLKHLADALARNPDDGLLVFLYAYELWFDNRKDEARMLFQRARSLESDPSLSDRFLQAKMNGPV
jgi:hypothetical protein